MLSTSDTAILAGAGAVAGLVGTAGGITSLISYPALLAVGIPAVSADVANIVALIACWPGSALASRPELEGRGPWLGRWVPLAAAGGVAGAALLLTTPSGAFGKIVPFLVLAASVTLLLAPRLSAHRQPRRPDHRSTLLPVGLTALSVYNGFFGAGSGVMILALLLSTVDRHMARANALKNMLVGAATVASAVVLVIFGPVDWAAVAPLAAGVFAGSTVGPLVARRLPANVLRWLVALSGIGLAIRLWW